MIELAARRPRAAVLLDELAELARGGVDVALILERTGEDEMRNTAAEHATSIRLNPDDLAKLDRVVELLATSESARLVGGRWGRSTVLRLAVGRGLDALLAEEGRR